MAVSAIGIAFPAFAQTFRPDAGTVLENPRPLPSLPAPGGAPAIVLPQASAAAPFDRSVAVTPAAFRIQGNTRFSEAQLLPVLAPFVGQRTDMAGLARAAAAVRQFYRDRGYILTEVYLPAQQFAASGGTVTLQVLEARIGKADIRVEGAGPSEALVRAIVQAQLRPGELITGYVLEKPILLLRDLPGIEATAEVRPGTNPGEADVIVVVKPAGRRYSALIGADNHGPRAAGEWRGYVEAEANNLVGSGDTLSARVQRSDQSGSNLYRLGYSATVGGQATRLGLQVVKAEYALGKQFAALGAAGEAHVASASVTQPFIRSRAYNLYGALTVERKDLHDGTATPTSSSSRQVDAARLSLMGNFVDSAAGNAFSSYALAFTRGHLDLDPAALALDQGPTGLRTAGAFSKVNLDFQRATFLTAQDRVTANLQAQWASRNLTSAEQFGLGGPTGVRGYPVGEAMGDSGAILSLEYRHQFAPLGAVPVAASVFYDWGRVSFNEGGTPFAGPDSQVLSSAGVGFTAGGWGDYLLSLQLAWRTRNTLPVSDPDRKPRVWLSLQKWL